MKRISKKTLEKYKTIEDLVDAMVTDKTGKRLNFAEVGETSEFIKRYQLFKKTLHDKFPHLTLKEILFLVNNVDVNEYVWSWYGSDKLLTLLEYELEKEIL